MKPKEKLSIHQKRMALHNYEEAYDTINWLNDNGLVTNGMLNKDPKEKLTAEEISELAKEYSAGCQTDLKKALEEMIKI